MLSWVLALFISIFSFAAHSSQDRVKFPNVEKNVPYAKVASLAFSAADEKISYGENAEQYALLWRAKKTQNTQHHFRGLGPILKSRKIVKLEYISNLFRV